MKIYSYIPKKFIWLLSVALFVQVFSVGAIAKSIPEVEGQTQLFKNFPKVAFTAQEHFVDPKRINPDAMMASILQTLESKISRLVISLPKSLEAALESIKNDTEKSAVKVEELGMVNEKGERRYGPEPLAKPKKIEPEQLVLDLGGVKKTFNYESQRSIWGMIFSLRDIFQYVELESKKQGLVEHSKNGAEPIEWEKIEYAAINAMLSTLDPHSVFLEPKYARDLTLTTKGNFGGVGIVISVRDGFLTVISPMDGTPAALAGIKAKDRIVKIDDDSAINMDLNDAVNMLRGQADSPVRITVQRNAGANELEFKLKRSIIKVESVSYALLPSNVGYLRIKAFQGNTANDVKNAILSMKKKSKNLLSGVILDLRDNPGGLLREAVEISDLFLEGGEVVSTQGARKESRQVEMATSGQLDKNLKITVLVNGGSASASEIVAGALKFGGQEGDGRGMIIGEQTFGKGSVQMLFDFPTDPSSSNSNKGVPAEPAALKITIAEYKAPGDRTIQTVGLVPDIGINQIRAEKADELSLFQNHSMREIDLDSHLLGAKVLEEKPILNLDFLAPKVDEEGLEYKKLDVKTLKDDFSVRVAEKFILDAKGTSRSELLENAEKISKVFKAEEDDKIIKALKKHNIDWTMGNGASSKDSLLMSIVENKPVKSGQKLKLSFKVKNVSKSIVHQVYAITSSKTPLFDQRELLFGKLLPDAEIERSIEFEIPIDVVSRKDLIKVELKDSKKEILSALDLPIDINGLDRPQFAHMAYIDDSKHGNGDAKVQKDENVDLVIWVKNIGQGKSPEPTVLLRNESGSNVFLKNGRVQAKELLPKEETSMRFSFNVKEVGEKAKFEMQIFDGKFHDIWRDKVIVDLAKKTKTEAINRVVELKAKTASLYSAPDSKSPILASLLPKVAFKAILEVKDFYAITVSDNLVGYVNKSDVVASKSEANKKNLKGFAVNYERVPAQIKLSFGNGKGYSNKDEGSVSATISGASHISEVLMYVNGKKVLYKSLSSTKAVEKVEQKIALKPGVNIISLLAREDSIYGQLESLTVYFDPAGKIWPSVVPETKDKQLSLSK